jgi:DNA-binding SARP family transcriptional activator
MVDQKEMLVPSASAPCAAKRETEARAARSIAGPSPGKDADTLILGGEALPPGFVLEKDPDTFILRHPEGSAIGVFSVRGFSAEEVRRAAGQSVQRGTRNRDHRRTLPAEASDGCLLRARFFGRFELFCCGRKIDSGSSSSSKALSILKHLLVDRNEPVSQDHLMGWLWPESNLKRARGALNTSIHALRKILDSCPLPVGYSSYVILQDGYYRLCPAVQVWTDADEFDSCCDEGRSMEKAQSMSAAVAKYERAVELYRGDYLAEDLYEEWTMIERQRFANTYVDVLHRLSDYYADTEQYSKCIEACYKILKKDAYYEAAHRLLMSCYARLGMRTQALQQYRLYERMLRRAFNAEPAVDTRALYREITRGKSEDTHDQIFREPLG